MLHFLPLAVVLFFALIVLLWIGIRIYFVVLRFNQRSMLKDKGNDVIHVGIMHPYSTGGGGGERVLWFMIQALHELSPKIRVTLYTTDPRPLDELRRLLRETFNFELTRDIEQKKLFGAKKWLTPASFLTLFMHSVGSAMMGWEALNNFVPDVFMDTHGCAESFWVAKWLAGCKSVCYVHYPTISTDMLNRVSSRVSSYNNDDRIAKSSVRSSLKLWYYRLYAVLYGFVGMSADVVMVNSTWTKNHIERIWWCQSGRVHTVYPPVAVNYFRETIALAPEKRNPWILSIGQFRPEKDHPLMLRSFKSLLTSWENNKEWSSKDVRLVLLGGCRGSDDEQRVSNLKQMAKDLGIDHRVDFITNAPFSTLTKMLQQCTVGLHTMWNEHFGICVVEYMAAGLIPLAHRSAGPEMDIVVDYQSKPTGFLATTEQEYASGMKRILEGFFAPNEEANKEMRSVQANARQSTDRFSEEQFVQSSKGRLSQIIVTPSVVESKQKSE